MMTTTLTCCHRAITPQAHVARRADSGDSNPGRDVTPHRPRAPSAPTLPCVQVYYENGRWVVDTRHFGLRVEIPMDALIDGARLSIRTVAPSAVTYLEAGNGATRAALVPPAAAAPFRARIRAPCCPPPFCIAPRHRAPRSGGGHSLFGQVVALLRCHRAACSPPRWPRCLPSVTEAEFAFSPCVRVDYPAFESEADVPELGSESLAPPFGAPLTLIMPHCFDPSEGEASCVMLGAAHGAARWAKLHGVDDAGDVHRDDLIFEGQMLRAAIPFAGLFCAFSHPEYEDVAVVRFYLYTMPELPRDDPSSLRIHLYMRTRAHSNRPPTSLTAKGGGTLRRAAPVARHHDQPRGVVRCRSNRRLNRE